MIPMVTTGGFGTGQTLHQPVKLPTVGHSGYQNVDSVSYASLALRQKVIR